MYVRGSAIALSYLRTVLNIVVGNQTRLYEALCLALSKDCTFVVPFGCHVTVMYSLTVKAYC